MAPWCLLRVERKKERRRGRKEEEKGEKKKKPTRLLRILILHRHTDQAHYTDGDGVELQKHSILEVEAKGGVCTTDGHPNTFCS